MCLCHSSLRAHKHEGLCIIRHFKKVFVYIAFQCIVIAFVQVNCLVHIRVMNDIVHIHSEKSQVPEIYDSTCLITFNAYRKDYCLVPENAIQKTFKRRVSDPPSFNGDQIKVSWKWIYLPMLHLFFTFFLMVSR